MSINANMIEDANRFEEKLLLVDDNPVNLQMLCQLLEKPGVRLLVAKTGIAALEIAKKTRPGLILLDIMMPGIDGFEVCRRLKADPTTRAIPVIFLSALNDTADKVKGLQLGAVDYVPKPFQPDEVIARVNTHLTLHRLTREVRIQRDRLVHELTVVSNLQRDLLPERLPDIPGLNLAVYYDTSLYAGGDYYDVVELPGKRCGLLVADAEGHSAPAAVMMAMTCALFRSCPELYHQPGRLIDTINRHLCRVNKESFVTAIYGLYDSVTRTIQISRAGHPYPILFRPSEGQARELVCDGVFLMGVEAYDQVPETTVELEKGDRLLFYTDGVTERFNARNRPYGEERLCRQLALHESEDPNSILKHIIEDLDRFSHGCPSDDDIAMLLAIVA